MWGAKIVFEDTLWQVRGDYYKSYSNYLKSYNY